ncbi:hypothetical protein AAE02nite_14310 [Adhaeribacter aerolatus]|uniref:Uncharacterized protein n=1 Tax=Adhaeribacter aerolatus TaxID=670289 RepID=A0A512AW81_9BACT|nr:hypothetical protein [Adhaeribacter aerolatus]GEO03767.1 hypothetical protein AAE02nite_14310 [Adhaeribacter aerolatus]
MAKTSFHQLEEIFRTPAGVVYQCNRNNCFWLEFAGGISAFKIHDLLELKKRVEQINLEEMAHNTARVADVVILNLFRTERCFVLTLTDVLNLRELLQGAKVMLELNSILHDCLHAMAV